MANYSCIIVDDDEIDRLMVYSFAKNHPSLNVKAVFEDGADVIPFLNQNTIDILFADIDMPELSGIELRKNFRSIPVCIFITSHPEYALESFELEALDFVVKPLKADRFKQAVMRAEHFLEIRQKAGLYESALGDDTLFIKEGHEQTKVKLQDILYLEALKDYTLVVTAQKKHCVLSSIGNLLKENHFDSFLRIHKSFAVNKKQVIAKSSSEVKLSHGIAIPVGRSYKENLNQIAK